MHITRILEKIRPNAKWKLCDEDYDQLVWYDTIQTKPTLAEVEAEEAGVLADIAAEQAEKKAIADTIVTNLPSWTQVETVINNISNLTEAKSFLLKLSKVVYQHIKETTNGS